jgi:hypothetical protein
MGLLFYLAVLPTGLMMRAIGKDMLVSNASRTAPATGSRVDRPGPAPETMKDQF